MNITKWEKNQIATLKKHLLADGLFRESKVMEEMTIYFEESDQ